MHRRVFGSFKYPLQPPTRLPSSSVFVPVFSVLCSHPHSCSLQFPSHFLSKLIDCKAFGYGVYRGLNLGLSPMALTDLQAMCAGKNSGCNRETNYIVCQLIGRNQCSRRNSGMAFEPDRFEPKRSSLPAVQIVHSETSFKPWSRKFPIGDGYHEFL